MNKEDIILGILSRIGEFDHKLEAQLAGGNTAADKLRSFIQFHFDFFQKNKEITSVLSSEDIFNQSDLLRQKLIKIIKYRKSLLTSIVDLGKAENDFKSFEQ